MSGLRSYRYAIFISVNTGNQKTDLRKNRTYREAIAASHDFVSAPHRENPMPAINSTIPVICIGIKPRLYTVCQYLPSWVFHSLVFSRLILAIKVENNTIITPVISNPIPAIIFFIVMISCLPLSLGGFFGCISESSVKYHIIKVSTQLFFLSCNYSKRHNKFLFPALEGAIYVSSCKAENEISNVVNYRLKIFINENMWIKWHIFGKIEKNICEK